MSEPIVKQTRKNGKFLNAPGPGRPKGSKNKYTAFAYDLFNVWEEVQGSEKLKEFIGKNDRNFGKYLEVMARLMPKELKLSGEIDSEVTLKQDVTKLSTDELEREIRRKISAFAISRN
jgi:hypothetical protein